MSGAIVSRAIVSRAVVSSAIVSRASKRAEHQSSKKAARTTDHLPSAATMWLAQIVVPSSRPTRTWLGLGSGSGVGLGLVVEAHTHRPVAGVEAHARHALASLQRDLRAEGDPLQ